jgi:DNA-binding GntR family transcriptional regulator
VGGQRVQEEYRSKTDLVASAIKEMIHSGELEPGAVLRQRDIAELLGVSPTPVREALRRLEGEGFLLSQPHSSTVVVRAEDRALYENAQIRAALESLGTELAAEKATAEDIVELEEINREFEGSVGETAVNLNRQFHFRIYEIAASPVLRAQLRLLWQMLDGGPRVERLPTDSAKQHQEIIDAIRDHDSQRAGELVRRHILEAVPDPSA